MSKIRSAWEIALEKTEDIKIDEKKLQYDEDVKRARTIAGVYINGEEERGEDVAKRLGEIKESKAMKEGVKLTLIQNLNLPSEEVLTDRFERVKQLAMIISNEDPEVDALMTQMITYIKQYPLHRRQLVDQLKEQYAPALAQKAAELQRKYGQQVAIRAEDDPDFLKIAENQLERLSGQYTDILEKAKAQLSDLLG